MSSGVINKVPFGVRNEDFERIGAGSADRYSGEDGLISGVAKAARIVVEARRKNASKARIERAQALLSERVGQLFDAFERDAVAIEGATVFPAGDTTISYNSLHVSVRNPNYVPPKATTTHHPDGGVSTSWDWSCARGREFIDVTPQDILADPSLGLELVVRNDFHL